LLSTKGVSHDLSESAVSCLFLPILCGGKIPGFTLPIE
jgi:hypothetical protein